nr:hypothetical protein [Tanacetum cinerariifolium]
PYVTGNHGRHSTSIIIKGFDWAQVITYTVNLVLDCSGSIIEHELRQ